MAHPPEEREILGLTVKRVGYETKKKENETRRDLSLNGFGQEEKSHLVNHELLHDVVGSIRRRKTL